jgi:predicted XRE-type DNA-binding protein
LIIYALRFTNTLYSDRDRIMKNNDILIEEGSGNIFADLGYASAEEALLKSNLAQAIVEVIDQQKLSEVDAFTRLGINALMLSKLKRGQLRELETGELFRFVDLLNQDVEIIIRDRSKESLTKTLNIMSV